MFAWEVPARKDHGASWYTAAAIIMISFVAWGILIKIYALAVVVVLLAGVYIFLENNSPENTNAIINENGIGVGEGFYDYGQIQDFSLFFDGGMPKNLRVRFKKNTLRYVDIPLMDQSAKEIRTYLLGYLPEWAEGELGLVDRIIEKLSL